MAARLKSETFRRTLSAALAVTLFWALAWSSLSGAFTPTTVGQGAAIALNVLLISCLGLLYRPNRSRGFTVLAVSLSALSFLGFLAIFFAWDAFTTFITTPKPA